MALGVLGCAGNPMGTSSNPFGVPSSVTLAMPDSLKTVSALKSVSAYRTQTETFSIGEQIGANLEIYLAATELVDAILTALAAVDLTPGKPYTFTEDGDTLTVLLDLKADHAVISIGEGTSATGENQIIGISYTSPTKGRAVFRSREPMPGAGKFALETIFDLDAGKVSANGYSDTTMLAGNDPQEFSAHWEFKTRKEPPAGVPWFTVRASAYFYLPGNADESGVYALVANCLEDGSAAAILGVQMPLTGPDFTLIPSDASIGDVGFFLGSNGQDLSPSVARSDLKRIVPTRQTIYEPFPADPSERDPLVEDDFRFPR